MESSFTFWLTGLSGAGKTSLGEAIALHYRKKGLPTVLLDGDVLRSSILKDLGYSEEERMEQNRRAAALAKLLNRQGITVFAALISPLEKIRKEIEASTIEDHNTVLKNAPHTLMMVTADVWNFPYSREKAAFPLEYISENKFWPTVRRTDDAYGDRNLVCSCAPIEAYMES